MVVAYNALSVRVGECGGGETFTLNVLRRLPGALPDARIVILARSGETRLPDAANVDVHAFEISTAPARLAAETLKLPAQLSRMDADVLISPNESLPIQSPCPFVVVAQNLVYHDPEALRVDRLGVRARLTTQIQAAYYRRRMKTAFARADHVVAVSQETLRLLAAHAGLERAKTTVVWEGSDSFLLPEPMHSAAREPRLLVVSALAPYKNVERAVDVLGELRRRDPGLVLDVVGADWRGYRRVVEEHVRARGLMDAVHLHGPLGPLDVAALYERSLLLLHLSSCESFGLPVVEAMRYGLPVVAADRSSLPEVVDGAAVLVDPDDVRGMSTAVDALVRDPAARAELARRGRVRASALTWAASADGIAAVAQRVATRYRTPSTRPSVGNPNV